jgi:hypothetical protein
MNPESKPAASSLATTIEWLLAAVAALVCFALPVLVVSSPGNAGGITSQWPMPGLILLEIALLGLAGFAGIAGLLSQPRLHGPTLAWVASGALAALGVIGAYGVSVVFFALAPAVLFGLAAALADRRLHIGWRSGLSTLVLSAGVNALLVALLIGLART